MFPSDLDSTAGSEWEGESNAGSQHLSAVSKEQLFNMLQKSRSRYRDWKISENNCSNINGPGLLDLLINWLKRPEINKSIYRYHKYKGRFSDLAQAYKDLEAENQKVKDVMQQTQVSKFISRDAIWPDWAKVSIWKKNY